MTRLRADGATARQADLAQWPALVLTAGLATRLQPLSSVRAKAALPVAGEALVARILRWLHTAGVRRIVLNLHHRAETITPIVGDGSTFGLSVRYSWEPEVLGSAGGPARALPLLESDRFLIVNGDTLTAVDLRALAAQHVDTNAMVTMAVIDGDPRYNGVIADDAGIVHGFGKQPGAFHFIGVQAVNAAVFAGVSPGQKSETVHGIYPALIAGRTGAIRIFHTREAFHDIGSPRDYLNTAIALAARERRPLDRGAGCVIAADASVTGSVLWDRVTVGAGARLVNCVAADDVVVPPGADLSDCSLVMRGREMIVTPF
jgi:NDP-sugar pyrophosphorylase family protein